MRVFISWSGERSENVALVLREWLPSVVQALDTWVSSSDIEKGEAWFTSISESLVKSSGMGIFCLTSENLRAPWLAYEAGALASQDRGRVATFRFGVEPQEVAPPLGLFQSTSSSSKDDVHRLLSMLNRQLENPLSDARLLRAFEANWTTLADQLGAITAAPRATAKVKEDTPQLLNEILAVVRRIEKDRQVKVDTGNWTGVAGSGLLADAPEMPTPVLSEREWVLRTEEENVPDRPVIYRDKNHRVFIQKPIMVMPMPKKGEPKT